MTRLYAHDGGGDYFYVDKKEVTTHLDLIHYLLSRQQNRIKLSFLS